MATASRSAFRTLLTLVVLLAGAGAVAWGTGWFRGASDGQLARKESGVSDAEAESVGSRVDPTFEEAPAPVREPRLEGVSDPRASAAETEQTDAPGALPARRFAARYEGERPPGWAEARPAQRPHAIRPPGGRGKPLGGRGGVGPTGHWTRFPPPPPPEGAAHLVVRVVDEAGRIIEGADVYLGPPASLHATAVSFGDLRKLGRTGDDGILEVAELPAGAAALAGNVANQLNGARGLDMSSSIPILLLDGKSVRAELPLPVAAADFGRVTGRVVDEKERPIRSATVLVGYLRVYTDADGRFALSYVPAGAQSLFVSRSGYAKQTVAVDVPAGDAKDVEIKLVFAETGALRLQGTVLAAEGGTVAGATLYLMDESGRGTLRSVRSDGVGRYLFEMLPDRLATTACRLQAGCHHEGYPAKVTPLPDGLSGTDIDVTLPPRRVRVRFVLRDAATADPVTRCRIGGTRRDDPQATTRDFLGSNANGRFEHWYDPGEYRFRVEAPEHETAERDVALETSGDTVEVPVALKSRVDAGRPVTFRLRVTHAGTGEPVPRCGIDLLDRAPDGETVARFEGASENGVYSLPARSGTWRLRVTSEGFEIYEETLTLASEGGAVEHAVSLRPE